MFRTIQGKLVGVYLLLVLLAMQLAGLYLLTQLENAYLGKEQDDLHQSALLLVGQLQSLQTAGRLEPEQVGPYVERWPYEVYVLDANGQIVGATQRQADGQSLVGKKFTHDDVTAAFGGQPASGISTENGVRTASQAMPLYSGGQVTGVVYIRTSLEETYNSLRGIRDVLLVATLVAMGTTGVLGVALARTITGPVREVTRKAAEIAGGNFSQRIEVRSSDEIGQLGVMFNRMSSQLKQTLEEMEDEKNKVEAILTHMADGLLALDRDGRMIKLNPAAQRMFQVEEAHVLGGLPEQYWPELQLGDAVRQAEASNRTVTAEVHVGHQVMLAHVTALRGERGQPAGTVIVFHDITELEKLESMRREFVANVSHELKTPLTSVKSYVETLLDGAAEDPDVRTRFLKVVEGETDRMTRLVRDLLHLSQLDQGAVSLEFRAQPIAPLLDECIAKLAVPSQRKGIQVTCTVAPGIGDGYFDRDKIQQVVLNLLANAIEFTPTGGQIWVRVEQKGPLIWISVRDTGVGIPKEDLPRIFERFYRVDKARSRMLGGTGLGLAIARQIVELHQGTIAIDSTLGQGTVVAFSLAAAAADEGEVAG